MAALFAGEMGDVLPRFPLPCWVHGHHLIRVALVWLAWLSARLPPSHGPRASFGTDQQVKGSGVRKGALWRFFASTLLFTLKEGNPFVAHIPSHLTEAKDAQLRKWRDKDPSFVGKNSRGGT